MSVFSDPGSLVLIVGAVAIIAFLVHGLWFSGKPENRRLNRADPHDNELRRSPAAGKVRIVNTEAKAAAAETPAKTQPRQEKVEELPEIKEISRSEAEEQERHALQEQAAAAVPQEESLPAMIQINLVAAESSPYRGEDIESLCSTYGILRGNLDIYYVYENPQDPVDEVFRMCSLTQPYNFPKDMQNFSTPVMALYMNTPVPGKAVSYFKAMVWAAEIIVQELGGTMQDNDRHILTAEELQQLEQRLAAYDAGSSS